MIRRLFIRSASINNTINPTTIAPKPAEQIAQQSPHKLLTRSIPKKPKKPHPVVENPVGVLPMQTRGNDIASGAAEPAFLQQMQSIPLPLDGNLHKGQAGRLGIVGGSVEYTGAPYFAGISALRIGMDLVHVFCDSAAAPVIKAYTPELIVHPVLDKLGAIDAITPWLGRLHALVIGPGLGRDPAVLERVAQLIAVWRSQRKPLVLDADALMLIGERPELVRNFDGGLVLTPNAAEFRRLVGREELMDVAGIGARLTEMFGASFTVLEKGPIDRIWTTTTAGGKVEVVLGLPGGSRRRCGGQGDVLSGAVAAFYAWAVQRGEILGDAKPDVLACRAASFLTRLCNERAFAQHGRGMLTSDMVEHVGTVFRDYFEPPNVE